MARTVRDRAEKAKAAVVMKAAVHKEMKEKFKTGIKVNTDLLRMHAARAAKTAAQKKLAGSPESTAHLFGDDEDESPAKKRAAKVAPAAEKIKKAVAEKIAPAEDPSEDESDDDAAPALAKKAKAAPVKAAPVKAAKPAVTAGALRKLKLAEEKRLRKELEDERAEVEAARKADAADALEHEPESRCQSGFPTDAIVRSVPSVSTTASCEFVRCRCARMMGSHRQAHGQARPLLSTLRPREQEPLDIW